jgi:hypothetical protein
MPAAASGVRAAACDSLTGAVRVCRDRLDFIARAIFARWGSGRGGGHGVLDLNVGNVVRHAGDENVARSRPKLTPKFGASPDWTGELGSMMRGVAPPMSDTCRPPRPPPPRSACAAPAPAGRRPPFNAPHQCGHRHAAGPGLPPWVVQVLPRAGDEPAAGRRRLLEQAEGQVGEGRRRSSRVTVRASGGAQLQHARRDPGLGRQAAPAR